jgi:hypothetical protein
LADTASPAGFQPIETFGTATPFGRRIREPGRNETLVFETVESNIDGTE